MQLAAAGGGSDERHPHAAINSEFGRLAVSASAIREQHPLAFLSTGGGAAGIPPGSPSPPGHRARHNSSISNHEGMHMLLSEIISRDEAIKCANHYFDFNSIAFPFLERAELIPEMLELYDSEKEQRERPPQPPVDRAAAEAEERAERRKFIIYMMITIGKSYSVRLGDEHTHGTDKLLYSASQRYRSKAISREDMLCVQALLLLTIYSTDVPEAGSLWQTLGLAGRVTMAIGLHRRADSHVPPEIAEPRRRVFYSFYNLDRQIAATLSKPLTIAEQDIDIELPTDRPGDQPHRGYPIMQVHRYVVRHRRLLGCTLSTLYSVNGEQNALPEPQRRAIIGRLHDELEAWAADVLPNKEPPAPRTANHEKWLAINYHQMLCMLYRPSPLYPDTTPATLRALHDASSKCVDLYCELWSVSKVGFNLIQIIGLFVACISLLCCLCECDTRMHSAEVAGPATTAATLAELGLSYTGVDDPNWANEIRTRVRQCRDLFETFGGGTPLSAKYRDIFARVSELLLARYGPLHRDGDMHAGGSHGHGHAHAHAHPHHALEEPKAATPMAEPVPASADAVAADLAGNIANAWVAMNQLWFNLGDLFGDDGPSGAVAAQPGGGIEMSGVGGVGGVGISGVGGVGVGGVGGVGVGGVAPLSPLSLSVVHGMAASASGMPGLAPANVPASLAAGVPLGVPVGVGGVGPPYPALGYPGPYGQYAAYAASYPGPYGEYTDGGFDESWAAEHWRPEGEQWWGHI
jgi:hypothetical protein